MNTACIKFLTILFVLTTVSRLIESHDRLGVRDVDHIKEHMDGSTKDLSNMTDDDLLFHYFRIHDVEGNNKLDGCELLQSLLHFHAETSMSVGAPVKVFSDVELSTMVDSVLESDDKNNDGFIDYAEYLSGEISKGL